MYPIENMLKQIRQSITMKINSKVCLVWNRNMDIYLIRKFLIEQQSVYINHMSYYVVSKGISIE